MGNIAPFSFGRVGLKPVAEPRVPLYCVVGYCCAILSIVPLVELWLVVEFGDSLTLGTLVLGGTSEVREMAVV
jgi:hypothetical protein